MKTRKEEIEELLNDIDAEILTKFPEGLEVNNWLHETIAKKVKLEIERAQLLQAK